MKLINKNYILLFFFHSSLSLIFNIISYLPILNGLHNQKGVWNFMRDSSLYHYESLMLLDHLNSRNFSEYFFSYNDHINTKIISFFYMIFQFNLPISYIPFHSFIWVCSIVLVFKTTNILFNRRAAIISVIPFFYISYLTLYMGLLRESLSVLGYALYIFSSVDIYKNKIKIKTIILFILAFIILLLVRPFLIPIIFLFTIILLIYYKYKEKINFKNLSVILISIVFCTSLNTKSLDFVGLHDEHLKFLSYFKNIFSNDTELLTTKQSKEDTEFLTTDWLTNEITKNLNKKNFYKSDFTYEFLKNETKGMTLTEAIEKIIEISVWYKIKNQYDTNFDYIFITVLNRILTELIRSDSNETKKIIEQVLNFNINISYELEKKEKENLNKNTLSGQNLNETNASDNKNIIDHTHSVSYCLFGQISNYALKLNIIRSNFNYVKVQAGSQSDDLNFTNLCDILYYLPKISADAFLSPFPNMWFEKGAETGRIGRLISGLETIVTYTFLISFIFTLLNQRSKIFYLYPILLCCIIIMLLTAFAVPNYGALYRMRMGPLLIFFILGSFAFDFLISKFFNENKK